MYTTDYTIRIYTSTYRIKSSCVCNSGKVDDYDDEQRMNTLFPLFAVEFSIFSFDGFGFSFFWVLFHSFISSVILFHFYTDIYVLDRVSVSAPICVWECVFSSLIPIYILYIVYCILFRLLFERSMDNNNNKNSKHTIVSETTNILTTLAAW